ncbi:unnamed protein product [Knipowitschia caucasica]|uniref:Polyamine-modulated factor 1 n=1 Tax=Knipowitschia caucasica TaxID=637954 RepID=A0AAV2MK12_KNICA
MEQQQDDSPQDTENETNTQQKTRKSVEASSENATSSSESSTTTEEATPASFSRLKLFEKVMQKSLENVIEFASFKRFVSTFRPLYKKNPQRMENIYKQFIEELKKAIQEDIVRLIEEGRLKTKLDELDKLEKASKSKTHAWRPSGIPEQDLCSFLMPFYQKQEAYMRLELKKIQAENAALTKKVLAGRERISHSEQHISEVVEDWKASLKESEKLVSSLKPDIIEA